MGGAGMNAKHIKRATEIMAGIAWCQDALSYPAPHYAEHETLQVAKPDGNDGYGRARFKASWFHLSNAARDAAFRVWRKDVEAKLAAYLREAAQIGLVVEDVAHAHPA